MNETHDVKRKCKAVPVRENKPEPVYSMKPESKKHPEDRIGSLRIYLNVLPILLDDKPRRVKIAEYHKVTEQGAREWFAEFAQRNGLADKQFTLSAVWTPYPVYL